jgi:GNAT superfamily N-acetyltransferase
MTVSIRTVETKRGLGEFIDVPFRLRRDDPQWVPPLRFERRDFLQPDTNPFFEHAEAEYFLAERDGEVVGRVSAQVDERWDEYQGGSDGMFGFYEVDDDPEVPRALLDAASEWVAGKGRERLIGPMDFTTNDECGLLIEGYDEPSMILEPWHPPYYRAQIEGEGFEKLMDLLMWELWLGKLKQGDSFAPLIHAAAKKSREEGVVVRKMRKRDLEAEIARFMEVYNAAWGPNWGFVPITEAEVAFQAKNLKPILSEHWAMIAERDGEVVGAALTLPDIDQVLKKMNGRLFPFGWWHFLWGRRRIDRLRVFALGVKPEYQHLGVAAALYEQHVASAAEVGPEGGHMGWILETNEAMNRAMEGMGGRVVQRYRLYQKALGAAGESAKSGKPETPPAGKS